MASSTTPGSTATVACAGATPPEAMAALKQLGFISVVNFRTAEEQGADIEESQAAAAAAGMKYFPHSVPETNAGGRRDLSRGRGRCRQPAGLHSLRLGEPRRRNVVHQAGEAGRVGQYSRDDRGRDDWSTERGAQGVRDRVRRAEPVTPPVVTDGIENPNVPLLDALVRADARLSVWPGRPASSRCRETRSKSRSTWRSPPWRRLSRSEADGYQRVTRLRSAQMPPRGEVAVLTRGRATQPRRGLPR